MDWSSTGCRAAIAMPYAMPRAAVLAARAQGHPHHHIAIVVDAVLGAIGRMPWHAVPSMARDGHLAKDDGRLTKVGIEVAFLKRRAPSWLAALGVRFARRQLEGEQARQTPE